MTPSHRPPFFAHSVFTHTVIDLAHDLASFVWPVACVGCGGADRELCRVCRDAFRRSHRAHPLPPQFGAQGVWVAGGAYEGVRRDLIVGLKHGGRTVFARELGFALVHPLGHLIVSSVRQDPGRQDPRPRPAAAPHNEMLIVPIPSRPRANRDRGFRPLELVLRHALAAMPRVYGAHAHARVLRALRTLPGRTGQVGLTEQERVMNAGRVRVTRRARRLLQGRTVILVDDIITTGATLGAADRALTHAGARVIGACAIAAVIKRSASTSSVTATDVALNV